MSKQGDHSTQVFPLPFLYPHHDVHLNHLLPINQHKKTWLSSVFRANKSQYYHFNSCKKPDLPTDCQQQHEDQKKINLVLLLLLLPYNCVFPLLLVNENINCCFVSYNCNSIYDITNLMHTLIGIFFFFDNFFKDKINYTGRNVSIYTWFLLCVWNSLYVRYSLADEVNRWLPIYN